MSQTVRRNWLFEGEAPEVGKAGMNAAYALMESFDRSDDMWERYPPDVPMAFLELMESARDLAAKALILLGVQQGVGASARMIEFGARHWHDALAAVREGRPLDADVVAAVHQEWQRYTAKRDEQLWSLMEAAREAEAEAVALREAKEPDNDAAEEPSIAPSP